MTISKWMKWTGMSALMVFAGCAPAERKPLPAYLYPGHYTATLEGKEKSKLIVNFGQNYRYQMSRTKGGCAVAIESGMWSTSADSLRLRVDQSTVRENCASEWKMSSTKTIVWYPIRDVTYFSFQLLRGEGSSDQQWVYLNQTKRENG